MVDSERKKDKTKVKHMETKCVQRQSSISSTRSHRAQPLLPFCCRWAPCSLRSESRTCSVPWSPAAVTWCPSGVYRSTEPRAPTVYSHDTRGLSPEFIRRRAERESGENPWWRGADAEEEEDDERSTSICASLSGRCLVWALPPRSAPSHSNVVKSAGRGTRYFRSGLSQ